MASLKDISGFLDNLFGHEKIEDNSNNGLQVEGNGNVKIIAFAVDACAEVFGRAIEEGADMIIVHHGMSWNDSLKYLTSMNYNRVKMLIKNDVSLYAMHLPLDMHEKYGNNMQLAKMLELEEIEEFGGYHGMMIGYQGRFKEPIGLAELKKKIDKELGTNSSSLDFGKEKVETIGIVSGGGSMALAEAINKKLDCFLIGEARHSTYHDAKEGKINVIIAGHYQTETVGVKALMPLLEKKFGVKTIFVDVPTSV